MIASAFLGRGAPVELASDGLCRPSASIRPSSPETDYGGVSMSVLAYDLDRDGRIIAFPSPPAAAKPRAARTVAGASG